MLTRADFCVYSESGYKGYMKCPKNCIHQGWGCCEEAIEKFRKAISRARNNNRNNNNKNTRPNKNNDYGTKNPEAGVKAPEVCAGTVEYKMSKTMADEIIKASKSKRRPQEILCDYVNTQCGLQGYCVKVLVDLQ